MKAGRFESSHLEPQAGGRVRTPGMAPTALESLNLSPTDILPPARPHFPKQPSGAYPVFNYESRKAIFILTTTVTLWENRLNSYFWKEEVPTANKHSFSHQRNASQSYTEISCQCRQNSQYLSYFSATVLEFSEHSNSNSGVLFSFMVLYVGEVRVAGGHMASEIRKRVQKMLVLSRKTPFI